VPFPTPLHDRTFALCESLNYRDWAGYYAVGSYEPRHEHEYHAIRHAAGLVDISPLFKYLVSGRDACRLVDRVITRDASRMQVGQVIYTPWCDEHGRVLDDGTVSRIGEERFRWTAAEPNFRWLLKSALGLDVRVEDVSEQTSALALQGPMSAAILRHVSEADIDGLKYFRVTAGEIAGQRIEISRTGYTGDLGYEIWVDAAGACAVWDALIRASASFGLKPAGLLALDVARIEAGLLLIDVDFVSARKALTESRWYTPFEMGLGRLVDLGKERFIGRDALAAERERGPRRQIVGVTIEWGEVEALYSALRLPALAEPTASRLAVPVFQHDYQVGRMTSSTWSPVLSQMIGLATIDAEYARLGTHLEVEHTVDVVRRRVGAVVTATPFFNPPRKTATPPWSPSLQPR
jgi:aminomethyltransferase